MSNLGSTISNAFGNFVPITPSEEQVYTRPYIREYERPIICRGPIRPNVYAPTAHEAAIRDAEVKRAAEEEAQRVAAEAEAQRRAAEMEAQRAAEDEARRAADERAKLLYPRPVRPDQRPIICGRPAPRPMPVAPPMVPPSVAPMPVAPPMVPPSVAPMPVPVRVPQRPGGLQPMPVRRGPVRGKVQGSGKRRGSEAQHGGFLSSMFGRKEQIPGPYRLAPEGPTLRPSLTNFPLLPPRSREDIKREFLASAVQKVPVADSTPMLSPVAPQEYVQHMPIYQPPSFSFVPTAPKPAPQPVFNWGSIVDRFAPAPTRPPATTFPLPPPSGKPPINKVPIRVQPFVPSKTFSGSGKKDNSILDVLKVCGY
jgi:hypothetical protein